MCRHQLLACQDEHEQPDREETRREEVDERGVRRPERARTALNQLNKHGAKAKLDQSATSPFG